MKSIFNFIAIALISAVALAGCGSPNSNTSSESQGEIVVDHQFGTTKVNKNPSRIVVLDLGSLETLDRLGVVGIVGTAKRNLPSYLNKYETDDSITDVGTLKEVNFEKVQALSPDLIIISGRLQEFYDEFAEIGPTLYLAIDNNDYMNSFNKNARVLGEIFGKEDEVEAELAAVQNKIEESQSLLEDKSEKGLIVLYNNGRFSAYGKNSRFGIIHDVLGVKPAIESLSVSTHGNSVSNEFIEETNPDYLFIVDRGAIVNGKGSSKDEIENALIKQTNAYKNNKIIYLDPTVWYISGGGLISINEMADEVVNALR